MRRELHVRFCESPGVQFPRATRLVLCFEHADDAAYVWGMLAERFRCFGLALHPKKTRSFVFQPPRQGGGGRSATFDFLGFTLYWQRARSGGWRMGCKTRGARLRRALNAATGWCRRHRHEPVKEQHQALVRKLEGHFNYFGVNGNSRALSCLRRAVERAWKKWLNRRGQRARMNWKRFKKLLAANPLPRPTIRVQIWSTP